MTRQGHRSTLSYVGRWLLAFGCAVLAASLITSVMIAATGSEGDVLPFNQVLLVAWAFTSYYAALYGLLPAALLTFVCERYGYQRHSTLIFLAAGAAIGAVIAIPYVSRNWHIFTLSFALHAPLTGLLGGLIFDWLRRRQSAAAQEQVKS